jgi:hypothetical protein
MRQRKSWKELMKPETILDWKCLLFKKGLILQSKIMGYSFKDVF